MAHDPDLLDALESIEPRPWSGTVFRYRAGDRPPDEPNTWGARWNPPEVPAIYVALERETALAEFEHHLGALTPAPRRDAFTLYEIRVALDDVLDLRVAEFLVSIGVTRDQLAADDHRPCQRVGSAASWLRRGGLLVPSARRAEGSNLVVFPHAQDPNHDFEVVSKETMPPPPGKR